MAKCHCSVMSTCGYNPDVRMIFSLLGVTLEKGMEKGERERVFCELEMPEEILPALENFSLGGVGETEHQVSA